MKTLFTVLALVAFTAISANATTNLGDEAQGQHQQLFPQPQKQQWPFPQQQQTFPQPWQQPFPQPWQQPFPEPWQQIIPQQQQQFPQQPPFVQPSLQQQLGPCRVFLLQQCPLATVPFLRSQIVQQSSCQVIRQQCCQQLAQIPVQFRYQAIKNVVQAIIMQQQQQQLGQGIFGPPHLQQQQQQGQGIFRLSHMQQQLGQGFFHPQELAQFQALQTLSTLCNVNVPLPQFSDVSVGIGGS
ncbi:hypothetical protein ACQ4PT_034411 [Festuca glaucescens]